MADSTKYTSKLHSKRILILGGTSGIGYSVAEASLENGAHVTVSSSQESRVNAAVSSLLESYPSAKSRVQGFPCDVASNDLESNLEHLLSQTTNNGKVKLDHIVFTAGNALSILPLQEASLEKLQQAAMVRFNAPLLLAKRAVAHLNPGPASSITLTTGSVGEKPLKDWSVICGYASGLHGMTRNLALDLAPLRVNLVSPGAVMTPLWKDFSAEQMEKMAEHMKSQTTTGEMGASEDVAEAYLYAMRDRNVSGSMISTNGGALLK